MQEQLFAGLELSPLVVLEYLISEEKVVALMLTSAELVGTTIEVAVQITADLVRMQDRIAAGSLKE